MRFALALAAAMLAPPVIAQPAHSQPLPATQFNAVGTIGNLSMFQNREVPFWNETIPRVSGGAIRVAVKPFTELGFRGPEIFRLVSTGTLQFASTVLNYNSGEVPMNEAADLVGLFGSVEELHAGANAIRDEFGKFLEARHGIKLLGFGTYQAQVIYCRDAFTQVADLRGRKVRASGASQQAFVTWLGGSPVTIAFAEVQPALSSGVVDCAITGALSGYRSRWHEAARYISPMPVNFGLVAHLANLRWWNSLDARVRTLLEAQLRELEAGIFEQARTETATGIACNTGTAPCPEGAPASMRLVPLSEADEALRKRAFAEAILPAFAQRCGAECVRVWNDTIGKLVGATAR
jgi:TRAP-type C4-dicarboxylate transport system substrate-binding protein